jgi:hypothetical protein
VTTTITTSATLCPSYTLTVYEVDPNAIVGSQTQLAQTEFTLRVDQVGERVDRTVSATIESDQRDGDGEAELKVGLDDACANPIITPDSAIREGIQVTEKIETVPGVGSDGPPSDPDDDGQYEDVNGDGTSDLNDAFDLAFGPLQQADDLSDAQVAALDFDGDGELTLNDAFALAFGR